MNSWADYENEFGGLNSAYPLSYAVYLFFLNGGTTALVVRYNDPADTTASAQLSADITLEASSPGDVGHRAQRHVDTDQPVRPGRQPVQPDHQARPADATAVAQESIREPT